MLDVKDVKKIIKANLGLMVFYTSCLDLKEEDRKPEELKKRNVSLYSSTDITYHVFRATLTVFLPMELNQKHMNLINKYSKQIWDNLKDIINTNDKRKHRAFVKKVFNWIGEGAEVLDKIKVIGLIGIGVLVLIAIFLGVIIFTDVLQTILRNMVC